MPLADPSLAYRDCGRSAVIHSSVFVAPVVSGSLSPTTCVVGTRTHFVVHVFVSPVVSGGVAMVMALICFSGCLRLLAAVGAALWCGHIVFLHL
jgi:hypothetical protein